MHIIPVLSGKVMVLLKTKQTSVLGPDVKLRYLCAKQLEKITDNGNFNSVPRMYCIRDSILSVTCARLWQGVLAVKLKPLPIFL